MRLEEPRAVVLLFVSGKGVCAGSRKYADIKKAAEIVDKLIPPAFSER
jgi:TATA-box binding protein (TBP) (component of TFIID and TFIIIB)